MRTLRLLLPLLALLTFACNLPGQVTTPAPVPTASVPAPADTPLPTSTLSPSPPPPSPTAVPTPPSTPTPPPAPLWQQIHFEERLVEEQGQDPPYTLSVRYPVLAGSRDPRLTSFNQDIERAAQHEIAVFHDNLIGMSAPPVTSGSTFEGRYEITASAGPLLSVRMDFYIYMDGAAHPIGYTITYAYDLESGAPLVLNDLFTAPADALAWIADYCKAELRRRDIGYDPSFFTGADPTPENYRNWNLTPGGLQITFDVYQVAPYAAGPQAVLIPYGALMDFLRPEITAQLP
ncbi:MAG: hypothetical protein Fur0018_21310 [Anaerolineales bacterium]